MVRVSVFYDEEVKGQVFKVRGDERYARTTKTTIELGNVTMNESTFDLDISVNVYRDIDSSNLVIYDNDVIIYNEIWTSTDTARTITLEDMAFEIEHNIVAKYMGNDRCSPSSSKIAQKYEVDPRRAEAIITISNDDVQLVPHDNFTATITLSNEEESDWNYNQIIEVEYDGENIASLTTPSTTPATTPQFTIDDVGENGIHTLSIIYRGSTHLIAKTVDIDFSVGYDLHVGTIPRIGVYGSSFDVPITLKDYLGNTVSDVDISLAGLYGTEWTDLDVETTDSNGEATLSWVVNSGDNMLLKLYDGYNFEHSWTQKFVDFNSMTITCNPPRLLKGSVNQSLLSVDTGVAISQIPVQLTGYVTDTIYTDNTGVATKNIWGKGYDSRTITANVEGVTSQITLEDYIQYWNTDSDGELTYMSGDAINISKTASSVKLTPKTGQGLGRVTFNQSSFRDWRLTLEGVSVPGYPLYIGVRYRDSNLEYVDWLNPIEGVLTNAKIIIEKSRYHTLSIEIYKGNTFITGFSRSGVESAVPSIGLASESGTKQLTFTKLTLKGWND